MKRCPECRRDYDDTLGFCLEDGTPLVYGVSAEEPATAILHEMTPPDETATGSQIHMTDRTAILPTGRGEIVPRSAGFDGRLLAVPFLVAIIVLGGLLGYKYFSPNKQIESIAIMPFVNDSGNPDVEYLSDGMTETLISSLSQLPSLNVKPRSLVFRYKGKDTSLQTVGQELGVQALMMQ